MENVKQISIVLEAKEDFDEIEFLTQTKKFINSYKFIKIKGTHIKIIPKY
jgi:hypothetical protein